MITIYKIKARDAGKKERFVFKRSSVFVSKEPLTVTKDVFYTLFDKKDDRFLYYINGKEIRLEVKKETPVEKKADVKKSFVSRVFEKKTRKKLSI